MENLCDDQFAALLFFEGHRAFESADRDGGLIVRRALGGDALEPEAGRGHGGEDRTAAFGGEANQLVADAGDDRQERDSAEQFGHKTIERNDGVEQDGHDHDDEQEAGAAARVPGHELLGVGHGHGLARFEIEDDAMLGAVEFKDAADVFHEREAVHEAEENQHADHAVGEIERDAAAERGIDAFEPGGHVQGNELVHENEHRQREDEIGGEHPLGDFLGFLALFLFVLLDFVERDVGGEFEGFHAERHGLVESADAAEDGVLEDLVGIGDFAQG